MSHCHDFIFQREEFFCSAMVEAQFQIVNKSVMYEYYYASSTVMKRIVKSEAGKPMTSPGRTVPETS